MTNIPTVSFEIFSNRGLLYTDPTTGKDHIFKPVEATPASSGAGDDAATNGFFESLALIGSDAFRISDYSLLREMVSKISMDWYGKKLYGGIVEKLFGIYYLEGREPSENSLLTFADYIESKSRSESQYGTEFDMMLVSLVMNVNVRCVYNEAKGFLEYNCRGEIDKMIATLNNAGVDVSAYAGAVSDNVVDLWIYGYQHRFPMDPEKIEKLDHFCALKPSILDDNARQSAYKGAVGEDRNQGEGLKTKEKSNANMVARIFSRDKTKRKRRRLTMKEQYDIVQIFDKNPKLGHSVVAEQYGIARTTVSTVLKRKDLIKMEIGIALVRDKKYQATTCRRIFTSDYSQYKAIDWALYDWMQQSSNESKDQNFSSDLLKQKALQFAEKAGIADFNASEGWLNGFKNRFGLADVKKRGRTKKKSAAVDFPDVKGEVQMIPESVQEELDAAMAASEDCDDLILKKAKLNVTSHCAAVRKSKATSGRRGRPPKHASNVPNIPEEDVHLPPDVVEALNVVRKFAGESNKSRKIHSSLNLLERSLKNWQRKRLEEEQASMKEKSKVGNAIHNRSRDNVADDIIVDELDLKTDNSIEEEGNEHVTDQIHFHSEMNSAENNNDEVIPA
mmetsp:Transcript_30115/g.64595  ORF Transcript_30115/g.64595 Transcript_30115/m.64595 type:complete len:618 (-) Transcript_30115:1-1854(-)